MAVAEGADNRQADHAGARLDAALARHGGALRLYAAQFGGDADDLVQEAMIRLLAARTPPDHPGAWLFRVVRNLAISRQRSDRARRRREHAAGTDRPGWFVSDNGRAEQADRAADALGALPDDQREVVVARLWGELTFRQIGRLVGCSASAAHRRYEAALATMRLRLKTE